jgi:hypothetical protein
MRHWITPARRAGFNPLARNVHNSGKFRADDDAFADAPAALDAPPAQARAPSAWQLGWRQLLRDFRAGELRLLVVAVTLAVAALTAVGFFADRINGGLARDARQLLGGDAIVSSDQPAPATFASRARALGLVTATTANFPSMGRASDDKGGATRLVSVKAVSDAYPLRGRLRVRDAPGADDVDVAAAPAKGTVWVDNALLDALGLAVGDPLLLGDASLKIARIIVIEPDRGTGFASLAPRVMLNEADLAATGLVQPASRISYRLAVAADAARDAKVAEFVDWAEAEIKAKNLRGIRIESLATGRPEMRQTLDRAEKFLNLVALLAALLAAGRGRHRVARFRQPPPRRLRDAARPRPAAADDRVAVLRRVRARRPARQRRRPRPRLRRPLRLRLAARRAGRGGAAAARDLAGAVRRRRRLHAAVRLRPAAGAAARARAAAARDPARRRRDEAGVARRSSAPARSASRRCCSRSRATSSSA